jgi:hypothetical protein
MCGLVNPQTQNCNDYFRYSFRIMNPYTSMKLHLLRQQLKWGSLLQARPACMVCFAPDRELILLYNSISLVGIHLLISIFQYIGCV